MNQDTIDLAAFGPQYRARQPAECAGCGTRIQPGDMQRGDGDRRTICAGCGEAPVTRSQLRPARILRHLTTVNGTGAISRDLAAVIGEPPGKRALIITGGVLRRAELEGLVRRAGERPTRGGRAAVIWEITDAGRAQLALLDAADRRRRAGYLVSSRVHAWRQAMIADTRASLPAGLDHAERQRIARSLRCQGLTLADIGQVFGITRERVRQILALTKFTQ
jgi:hypothetical protein